MSTHEQGRFLPALGLTGLAAVWGSTFFMIRDLVTAIPPLDFLGVRFLISATVVLAVSARRLRRVDSLRWGRGVVLGLVFAAGQVTQTIGLQTTPASVSGFITGMYVVLTPLVLLVFLRRRIDALAWLCIVMACSGLTILSLRGVSVGVGEALTLVGALCYAIHIVLLAHWSTPASQDDLVRVQLLTIGAVCFLAALPGGIVMPSTPAQWSAVLYMALVAGVGAIAVQTWAQSRLPATSAAVIMSTEPVFAAFFAVLLGGESLTGRLLLGGGLIVAATFLTEGAPALRARMRARDERSIGAA